jgi:hypothetical protein
MKKSAAALLILAGLRLPIAGAAEQNTDKAPEQYPWVGKYPMSFFTKTRTAKTVGKDHWSFAVKIQHFDWDEVEKSNGQYHSRPSGHSKRKLTTVYCTKYGWAEDHHIALGVPFFFNDFETGSSSNNSKGLGNIFIFEKWNLVKETNDCPAVALDFWYYLPTGDSDRKLGSDDGAYKITGEVSKAWKDFSVHFNPGYLWNETDGADSSEVNAGVIFKTFPQLWPAFEYNYFWKDNAGRCHDLVPGVIWKFKKNWSFKVAVPISCDCTFKDRDRVGLVFKIFRRW